MEENKNKNRNRNLNFRAQNGFTLIEIFFVIAILGILFGIGIFSMRSFDDSVNLENTGRIVEAKIKMAKGRSIGALNGANHGVHFEADKIVVFEGVVFVDGAPGNEIAQLPNNITINSVILNGGGDDVIFNRLTGTTNNYGVIGMEVSNDVSKTRQILINGSGQSSFGSFQTSVGAPVVEDETNVINARHLHFELGWSIKNSTILRLEWTGTGVAVPLAQDIDTALYFDAGKTVFDWEGTATVDGEAQRLRIHTLALDDVSASLCVVRDRTKNSESLNIYFIDGGTKKIVQYEEKADGTVVVTPDGIYGGAMTEQ